MTTMTKRFDPSPMQRLSAVAIAAALTAFAGAASAQPAASPGLPGYAHSSDGRPVLSGFGQCVRSGFWVPANSAEPCDRVARADVPPPAPLAAAPEPALAPAVVPVVIVPPRPVIQKVTLSADVLFDFGKAELKDAGKGRLDQLAGEIKDAQIDEIIAVGHADRIASEGHNQKLSEARAQAVKDYLAGKVANANRVVAEGKGESQPVTGDGCKKMGAESGSNRKLVACLQPDRRVEIEVLGSREIAAGGAPAAGTGATSTPR